MPFRESGCKRLRAITVGIFEAHIEPQAFKGSAELKENLAAVAMLVTILLGIITPIVILVLIGNTPNTLLRQGSAGQFVSAESSAGSFLGAGIATVQATEGSIAVFNTFSAKRGQALVVQDTLKDGMSLCVVGRPDSCTSLAGTWTGDMQSVAHVHHPGDRLVTGIGNMFAALWLVIGIALSVVLGQVLNELAVSGSEKKAGHHGAQDTSRRIP
jgi:hypothetical protein